MGSLLSGVVRRALLEFIADPQLLAGFGVEGGHGVRGPNDEGAEAGDRVPLGVAGELGGPQLFGRCRGGKGG